MSINIKNNYETFKSGFKKDTGLNYSKETVSEYLQYLNFRINDQQTQMVLHLINQVDHLPNTVQLRISEMVSSNETIKELLKKIDKLK
jgi:hypothetical protein